MPLVKGSTIINSMLTCSIINVLSLTRFLIAKYLMSMCLLITFVVFSHKYCC
ncbi:LOW QUALITY PROTEIN: hypothetical protein PanWU01x14_192040 [Parasponia andersonii]|uniref:Uncharacterized protein n=1 Tax=Parasponia andersonii TaxID=3476 RepID=A0A2P5C1B7_PARAD|nr:LOW QUALITY PROTEIN: hypothetical protein PanWU01x14_192040 [Parasponia andersonii]